MNVTDNAAGEAVTESASDLTNIDNPDNWNFADPDEDNSEEIQAEGNEGETVEEASDEVTEAKSDEDEETVTEDEDDGQSEDENSEETNAAPELTDDTPIELNGGESVPLMELKAGYLRQSDYSRKTLEAATLKKGIEAQGQRIQGTIEAFTDYLASQIPDEPDINMAASDPQQYMAQKAQHDAVLAQVQKLMEMGNTAKDSTKELNEAERVNLIQTENAKLASMFPQTTSQEGYDKFFGEVFKAGEKLGYAPDEMKAVTDSRLIGLAYWAQRGMEADKAQKTVKEKVKSVPPVTAPNKRVAKGKRTDNRQAMQRLNSSGSMQDALAIDFE